MFDLLVYWEVEIIANWVEHWPKCFNFCLNLLFSKLYLCMRLQHGNYENRTWNLLIPSDSFLILAQGMILILIQLDPASNWIDSDSTKAGKWIDSRLIQTNRESYDSRFWFWFPIQQVWLQDAETDRCRGDMWALQNDRKLNKRPFCKFFPELLFTPNSGPASASGWRFPALYYFFNDLCIT